MLLFATLLTGIALVYGFSTIPNPAMQREFKLDHRRVSDLGQLQYGIEEFYRTKRFLPATLSDMATSSYSYSGNVATTDPVTSVTYEYTVMSEKTYQLCATFTTDSAKEEDAYDSENYKYTTYKSKFEHPQGKKCFDFTAPTLYEENSNNYPTPIFFMIQPTAGPGVAQ
jgi:hypothetical protein